MVTAGGFYFTSTAFIYRCGCIKPQKGCSFCAMFKDRPSFYADHGRAFLLLKTYRTVLSALASGVYSCSPLMSAFSKPPYLCLTSRHNISWFEISILCRMPFSSNFWILRLKIIESNQDLFSGTVWTTLTFNSFTIFSDCRISCTSRNCHLPFMTTLA